MSSIKNVVIIGAAGHLGPAILAAFDQDPNFTVSVLSRTSSTRTFPAHITVHRVSDEYPEAELLEAFKGQDAVVSTIATASISQQLAFIDAAIKAGVKRFVPSEFGSDLRNDKTMALLPQYFKGKTDTVQYLRSKESMGLTWTAFVTGPFFELAVQVYMGFDLKDHKALLTNKGTDTWSTTTLPTIGLAVKNAMLLPAETANKHIFIDSFTVSQAQILASLERLTETKWEVTYIDGEEQKKQGLEKVSRGDFSGAMSLFRYMSGVHGHGANYAEYEQTQNNLLSLPKENLDEVLAGILKK